MVRPAIFILSLNALSLARKIKAAVDGEIHAPRKGDIDYARAVPHLAVLFREGRPIIGICASGILIRAIASEIRDKYEEPPVIAVAEDGSTVVPLLGGHHGANKLARLIAGITGGHAAITTASDVQLGVAPDEPGDGYILANRHHAKRAMVAILAGTPYALYRHPGECREPLNPFRASRPPADWAPAFAGVTVKVTEHAETGDERTLIYHPQTLAIGIGCERGAAPEEVLRLVRDTLTENELSGTSVACHATIDVKEDEPAIFQFGDWVRYFTTSELRAETHRIENPSAAVEREIGIPSVAEAAALAAAGPASKLIVPKTKSGHATVAIARAPGPILEFRGRARGLLHVVGIGPGSSELRNRAAAIALEATSDWVGYDLYLELAADLKVDQTLHPFPLGAEKDRVRHAINLAKQGKQVALVCSGDAGIYAMAALVYEIIDREPCRIAVNVVPGTSAFQAAAAKAGAMIGHDFCCISLSDLLTPWEVIERRIKSAGEGDFVVSFYNPRSLKRRDQLERAFAILRPHRKPDTPVVIATNLGRPEEKLKIVNFSEFEPEEVDMLTLVMVGSSQSKSFKRGDGRTYAYTPRGYAKKREAAE